MFAGTPETALPSLEALVGSRHEVAAVVTRPDARQGRGRTLHPSPVAARATELGIEVLKPERADDPAFLDRLREIGPACCPIVAYGALLKREALDVPEYGWLNLHFSALPAWRGAAPVQAAIAAGDSVTGATTFRIEPALDSGPVFGVLTEAIRPGDTAGDLLDRLAVAGAELLEATLDGIAEGTLSAVPQSADGVSVAPKISVEQSRVRWDLPAQVVERRIRAVTPNPGAWTMIGDLRVKLGPVSVDEPAGGDAESLRPGDIRFDRSGVRVGTGSQPVVLGWLQPPGKKPMAAADWARGARLGDEVRAS